MNGIRRGVFQVLIFLFSSAICFGLAEAGLRLKNSSMKNYDIEMWRYAKELKTPSANPVLGHEHVKSRSAVLQEVTIRLNERGLRGESVRPRVEGKRRVLVLGSSITLGWGVPEEGTLTALLQQMFQKDGEDVEVLNAGIGNYNAVRCVELFLTKLADLQPTDIVLHYFVNGAEVLEPGGGNALLRNSEVAVTLWQVANRMLGETGEASLDEHYRALYAPASRGRVEMEGAVKQLADYARSRGIPLYLAMTPDVHDLVEYRFGYIHDLMADVARKNGYVFVDFLPAFRGLKPTDIFAMPGDPHPNGLGHQKMAQVLYPVLTGKS